MHASRSNPGMSYSAQDAWRKRVIEACKTHPSMCVETLAGRRRYLQHINSRNSGQSPWFLPLAL